jgi:hypothetical protein
MSVGRNGWSLGDNNSCAGDAVGDAGDVGEEGEAGDVGEGRISCAFANEIANALSPVRAAIQTVRHMFKILSRPGRYPRISSSIEAKP